eukprot:757745-Hanusia_phi.AAC.7
MHKFSPHSLPGTPVPHRHVSPPILPYVFHLCFYFSATFQPPSLLPAFLLSPSFFPPPFQSLPHLSPPPITSCQHRERPHCNRSPADGAALDSDARGEAAAAMLAKVRRSHGAIAESTLPVATATVAVTRS